MKNGYRLIVKCSILLPVISMFLLSGCSIKLHNETPSLTKSEYDRYKFELSVEKEFLVLNNSIKSFIIIDGKEFPIDGSGTGIWHYWHTALESTGFNISYKTNYLYWPIPFPIPLPGSERLPENGTIYVDMGPDLYVHPDELLIYCNNASCSEDLTVLNLSNTTITVTDVNIGPSSSDGVEDSSGNNFDFTTSSTIPVQLLQGQSLIISVRMTSTMQSCGTLNINTDYTGYSLLNIPLSGKIFLGP